MYLWEGSGIMNFCVTRKIGSIVETGESCQNIHNSTDVLCYMARNRPFYTNLREGGYNEEDDGVPREIPESWRPMCCWKVEQKSG